MDSIVVEPHEVALANAGSFHEKAGIPLCKNEYKYT